MKARGLFFLLGCWMVLPIVSMAQPAGEKISLRFENIEIRAVLQIIADFAGFNLVATDTVVGNITLRLDATPWEEALEMILHAKGLAVHKEGKILFVAPAAEFAAREKVAPLQTELIQIHYAKAEDMAKLLKQEKNSLLSERGNIAVDLRTNTLLIQEQKEKLDEIRHLITKLDKATRQVQIEARIVVTHDDLGRDLGVRLGFNMGSNKIKSSGSLEGADRMRRGLDPNRTTEPLNLKDRLNVILPISGASGALGFVISKLPLGTLLDLELSALESEGKGEIISSPSIITSDQQQAHIESGEEIPYPATTTSNGVTEVSITFKKAVLSLKVTPHITPDNQILLGIEVIQDTRGKTVLLPNGGAVPAIDTQLLQTTVLVENGETIVLGGVYKQTSKQDISRVPVLGKIPFLGVLFRRVNYLDDKQELLIFMTPKIIGEERAV